MCGICGAINVGRDHRGSGAPITAAQLGAMTAAMRHRGPDDCGTHLDDGVAFGATRLSIIDVEHGHQPFASEDGTVIGMQNGELYTHDALREGLRKGGHVFRTRCDTEIIPHLYEEYGDAFAEKLRGMFAIAVWDVRRRRAVLVRDRLGIKPLYYSTRGDTLYFASELKSLLASGGVDAAIDAEALELYLTLGFVPAPRTILTGVRKLPPGHRLVADAAGIVVEQYWRYPVVAGPQRGVDVPELAEELLERLRESVRLRLMSDVPLGAMLSGGLDSSVIVALMAEQSHGAVKTFSVGFRGSASNELADAREVAKFVGADHFELELEEATVDLPELVWHLDEPLADLSSLGFLQLSRLARQHVTVALSGQGADEVFSGYRDHLHAALARRWLTLPAALRQLGAPIAARSTAGMRRRFDILNAPSAAARTLASKRLADPGDIAALLPETDGKQLAIDAIASLVDPRQQDPVAASLAIDAQLGLPDDMLHYFDRASMAHSLEVRVPFLDHTFVEWAATVPVNAKLHGRTTKHVLRHAARPLVPPRVLEKRKVGFFNSAVEAWLSQALEGDAIDYLLPESPLYGPFVDRAAVERLVAQQRTQPTARRAHVLLALLLLEVWLRTFIGSNSRTADVVVERQEPGAVRG
jgi:asparagine synthase (glutamine-hydrolysing)